MIKSSKEIKIDSKILNNEKISIKIGTCENKNNPNTIYIKTNFWLKSNKDSCFIKEKLEFILSKMYKNEIKPVLLKNEIFPIEKDNIIIYDIPKTLNFNKKSSFISIEIYLHTCNIHRRNNFMPLSNKNDVCILDEALKISKIIAKSNFLNDDKYFQISKKKI